MGSRGKLLSRFLALTALLILLALFLYADATPVLNQGYVGAVTVAGTVAPGNGPVSIFDLSYPTRTQIGASNSIDANGNFAAAVNPPLILNHNLIAVDAHGVASQVMIVATRPSSPVGPGE